VSVLRSYQVLDPASIDAADVARETFAEDVLVGLSERPKRISSKYFYDGRGSRLFQKITDLGEYYLTRAEAEIFETRGAEIVAAVGNQPMNLVDLGAGDGRKTALLLEQLLEAGVDVHYVPIDISESAMAELIETMGDRFPDLSISGLVGEYFEGVRWIGRQSDRHNLVLFLGSNIGNLNKPLARAFLRRLWRSLNDGDHVLIGFDLKKDIELLLAAYNDSEGITSAFNLNLLTRINEDLDADFDVSMWRFFCTYNVFSGAMESYLVSLEAQTVRVGALHSSFTFAPWEPIHTEYSYKYLDRDIAELAAHGGFHDEARFYDSNHWFCDALWRARK
jgi:L-histidine N-alpha-methyltransferase